MQQDRVAVGRGLGGLGGGERAAGAGDVLDHDRLAESPLQRVLEDARGGVVGAAGREGDQQGDGTAGVGLGARGAGAKEDGKERRETGTHNLHLISPGCCRTLYDGAMARGKVAAGAVVFRCGSTSRRSAAGKLCRYNFAIPIRTAEVAA